MAKLYGKGTITELVKGKKYHIELSAGKDPLSGREYASSDDVPAKAYAIDHDGKPVKPRITWAKATDEQKTKYSRWKSPVEYLRHRETFLGTKRQAELRVEEIRRELESGKRLDADKVLFADWCEQYLSMREGLGKKRKRTLKQDRYNSKHLLNALGAAKVVEITPAAINDLYVRMRSNGVGDTTVLQCHRLLKRIMKYALDNDLIVRNPVDRVETPKKPKPHRNALSSDEARRFSAICTSGTPSANKTAAYLGLALGARLGEVLGLTWSHVALDAKRPYAYIVQQHTKANERTPLKTDADDNPIGRVVPLDASTIAVLRAWRRQQQLEMNALGIEPGTETPIVTSPYGCWQGHANFTRWWQRFCVENGFGRWLSDDGTEIKDLVIGDDASLYPGCIIEWRDSEKWPCDATGKRFSRSNKRQRIKRHYDGLVFHELRHTHFTMRLAAGMDIPTAQALGGWSTPDVLMSVYAHPTPENVWDSVGFMDDLTAKQTA